MYAALAAESEYSAHPARGLLASGKIQHVAHGENALLPDEPAGCLQSAFRKHSAVARHVVERQLLEESVEYELVSPWDRAGPDARRRYRSVERIGCRLSDRDRCPG